MCGRSSHVVGLGVLDCALGVRAHLRLARCEIILIPLEAGVECCNGEGHVALDHLAAQVDHVSQPQATALEREDRATWHTSAAADRAALRMTRHAAHPSLAMRFAPSLPCRYHEATGEQA